MKNQKLAVGVAVFLLALLVGFTGCRRKRADPSVPSSVDQPAAEASGTPAPAAPRGSPQKAAIPSTHPGEAKDPEAIKLAMDQFQRKKQRPPNDWQEMIDAKVMPVIPKRKDGQPLNFSEYTEFYIHRGGQAGRR